ncbi:UNVERIFIED_CONTAM: hypothetical protein FKN15_042913 [Acipenser sinensis]
MQVMAPRSQKFLAFMEKVRSSWDRPPSAPSMLTEMHLKRAHAEETQVTHLANTVGILTAYMDGVLREAPLRAGGHRTMSPVQHAATYIMGMASLVVARRQLWLSQARVPDTDKAVLQKCR